MSKKVEELLTLKNLACKEYFICGDGRAVYCNSLEGQFRLAGAKDTEALLSVVR